MVQHKIVYPKLGLTKNAMERQKGASQYDTIYLDRKILNFLYLP